MPWRAAALLALISWGALAFGAPYPWAFIPLYAGCAVVGLCGFLPGQKTTRTDVPLGASLAILAFVIGVQLVPLQVSTIRWISPETDAFLQRYALGYAVVQRHPLSIEPAATLRALVAVCALSVLLLGSARLLRDRDTLHVARGTAVLGVVMAIAGIAQKAMWNGKIYGFWTPQTSGDSFGPFVNRNHFAGWMLMALPLVIGYFCNRIARGMRGIKPGWHNRVIWFSSADASETILTGFAALLMALALVLTMSRSGAGGLLVALAVSGWLVSRRQSAVAKRATIVVYLLFVAFFTIWWAGLDRLAARFADGQTVDAASRLGIWADTWRIARRFPLVGTGLDTFGTATIFFQTADLDRHYAQAHNDYLQLVSDGGLLVCVPAAIVAGVFVWRLRRRFQETSGDADYWIRMGAVTGILAVALQETVDFSLQMPGNLVLFVLLAALAMRRPASARTPTAH
jgi:O-antigen ligase